MAANLAARSALRRMIPRQFQRFSSPRQFHRFSSSHKLVSAAVSHAGSSVAYSTMALATVVGGGIGIVSCEEEERKPTVTASGLQFIDHQLGQGETPSPGDFVLVHYGSSHDSADSNLLYIH